jgi:hypothetical protein
VTAHRQRASAGRLTLSRRSVSFVTATS